MADSAPLRPRVAVGLSGGVDSAVAALLLKEQGHDVLGLTMITSAAALRAGAAEALRAAETVARQLGLDFALVDLASQFEELVERRFVQDYARGLTPNPCVVCNRELKFGLLLRAALARGAERFATGHYTRLARVALTALGLGPDVVLPSAGRGDHGAETALLRRAVSGKDQTYMLCRLRQDELQKCIFPLGEMDKADVRHLARQHGLAAAARSESQEVCFLHGEDYRTFLRRVVPDAFRPGPITDLAGRTLGRHGGLAGYTVGQRKGLGGGGPRARYVVAMRVEDNALVVGPEDALQARALLADEPSFAAFAGLRAPIEAEVQIRSRQLPAPATVLPLPGGRLEVRLHRPQRAVAPGQTVAIYRGDWLLGGARITGAPREDSGTR